jgi:hypothetical protein
MEWEISHRGWFISWEIKYGLLYRIFRINKEWKSDREWITNSCKNK